MESHPINDVQLLLAEREIKNVVLRYCRGIDRMDLAMVRSCYHADAQDHHGDVAGGVDEALRWVWDVLATYASSVHLVANMLVEIDATHPTRARCESYGMALHFDGGEGGRRGQAIGFRFIDDLEQRTLSSGVAEWRFARRVATTEWIRRFADDEFSPIPDRFLKGRRDRDCWTGWRCRTCGSGWICWGGWSSRAGGTGTIPSTGRGRAAAAAGPSSRWSGRAFGRYREPLCVLTKLHLKPIGFHTELRQVVDHAPVTPPWVPEPEFRHCGAYLIRKRL